MIFIGFNRYIFRIWTNGIKRSLSSVLTASIIFTHIRSRFVVVLLQYRGVISVMVTKPATATVTFSYCSRAAECGVRTHHTHSRTWPWLWPAAAAATKQQRRLASSTKQRQQQ